MVSPPPARTHSTPPNHRRQQASGNNSSPSPSSSSSPKPSPTATVLKGVGSGPGRSTSLSPSPSHSPRRSGTPLATASSATTKPASPRLNRSSTSPVAMDNPELAKCSREVLMEMVGRHKTELEEAQAKVVTLEEDKEKLLQENQILEKDFEVARSKIDDLLTEESRM